MASVRFRNGFAALLVVVSACTSMPRESPAAFKGHLELGVAPNPLVARRVGDDLSEFAFDIVMREAGGVDLLLSGASLHVSARTTDANGRHDTSEVRIPVVIKD